MKPTRQAETRQQIDKKMIRNKWRQDYSRRSDDKLSR